MFFLICFIAMFLVGLVLLIIDRIRNRHCTQTTKATIIDVKHKVKSDDGDTYHTYCPIIKYTVNGKPYRSKAPVKSANRNDYKIGKKIEVRYHPDKPEIFVVNNKSPFFTPGIILSIIGFLMMMFCIYALTR